MRLKLPAAIAAALLTVTAALAAVTVPATAQAGVPPKCFTEVETYKSNGIVYATAIKDCTNDSPPVGLGLWLQVQACDAGGCMWANWKYGVGSVSASCASMGPGPVRSSRLPSVVVSC
jgi:hypothetical protein